MKDYNTMAAMVTTRNHLNFLLNSTNLVQKDHIKSVRRLVSELDSSFLKMVMDENKPESMSVSQVAESSFKMSEELGAVIVTPVTNNPVGVGVDKPQVSAKQARAKAVSTQDPDVVAALARKKAAKK